MSSKACGPCPATSCSGLPTTPWCGRWSMSRKRGLAAVPGDHPVVVRVRSYPDRRFPGTVALVYPHLNASTRTVRVRIELPNPDFLLRPDMYAEAEIDTGTGQPALTVPDKRGDRQRRTRQFVIVEQRRGAVRVRARSGSAVAVPATWKSAKGIATARPVVTSANFLIDAESNLKSALKSLTGAGAPAMIAKLIEASARNLVLVLIGTVFAVVAGHLRDPLICRSMRFPTSPTPR